MSERTIRNLIDGKYLKNIIAYLLTLLVTGCTSVDDKPNLGRTISEIPDPERYEDASTKLSNLERCHLRSYINKLKAIDPENISNCTGREIKGYRPELGISISGGGLRSGTIALGILAGLNENNILDKVDIISSVSGGTYASSWYAINLDYISDFKYNQPYAVNDLFGWYYFPEAIRSAGVTRPPVTPKPADLSIYAGQTYIEGHSHLLTKSQGSEHGYAWDNIAYGIELSAYSLLWIPTIPLNAFANGIFRWQINLNPWENIYEHGIHRTFGSVAYDWYHTVDMKPTSFTDLAEASRAGLIPYTIINTTAAYGGQVEWARTLAFAGFNSDLASTIYEFTPIAYGNTAFGYCDYQEESTRSPYGVTCHPAKIPSLAEATMISGAAVDALKFNDMPVTSALTDIMADALNLSLGKNIENPRVPPSTRIWNKFLPFPLYLFSNQRYDEERDSIYLSDGGHSENLGIASLVKRKVKNIIAVDSEYEAVSNDGARLAVFDGLQRLRCHLWKENGLKFFNADSKPELDSFLNADGCRLFTREEIKFDFTKSNPFFRFDICPSQGCTDENRIRVLYVKLSINTDALPPNNNWDEELYNCDGGNDFSCEAVWLYNRDISGCKGIESKQCSRFPHVSTADIKFSRQQVNGHRALGYDFGRRIQLTDNGPTGTPFKTWAEESSSASNARPSKSEQKD